MSFSGDATEHAGQPMSCDGSPALPLPESVPSSELLRQVEFNNSMWWTMPQQVSTGILQQCSGGAQKVTLVWGWRDARMASYITPEGAATIYKRYELGFTTMHQRNINNHRTRRVRLPYVVRLAALSSFAEI